MNETVLKPETKKCPYCNKIIDGRSDKVFCTDRCRNNYYYKINSVHKQYVRKVNSLLLRNRGILNMVNPYGRTSVPKEYLERLGFDFRFFTGIHKTKKGKEYYLVYDHAYSFDEQQRVQLVVFYSDNQTIEG